MQGSPPPKKWSGRRGSNPRPTAWKAVTLPLSYSRLASLVRGASPPRAPLRAHSRGPLFPAPFARGRDFARPVLLASSLSPSHKQLLVAPSNRPWSVPPKRAQRALSEGGMAREGFEPSKPLGRQIYSLLRLTAPQPRRESCSRQRHTPFRGQRVLPSGRGGRDAVRSRAAAPKPAWKGCLRPAGGRALTRKSRTPERIRSLGCCPLACSVLTFPICSAGVAQPGRAADL